MPRGRQPADLRARRRLHREVTGKGDLDSGRKASKWLLGRFLALAGLVIAALVGVAVNRVDISQREASTRSGPLLIASVHEDWSSDDGYMAALPSVLSPADSQALLTRFDSVDSWTENLSRTIVRSGGVRLAWVGEGNLSFTRLRLVLETTQPETVTVSDIRARVLKCGPPLAGSLIFAPPQGAADVVAIRLDLDHPEAAAMTDSERHEATGPYFRGKFLTVGRDNPQVVTIRAYTRDRHCTWELVLEASSGGRASDQAVRLDDGRPFETTAWATSYAEAYSWPADGYYLLRVEGPVARDGAMVPGETGADS
jgi:hypothetical protein